MVKTTVYLEESVVRALRRISTHSSKPQAELIREALRKYTASQPSPLPDGMGMFDSGKTDTTRRRKDILAQAALKGRWRS